MKKVLIPQSEAKRACSLLCSGDTFEVLAQATPQENGFAAFVLAKFGWSWGHFSWAAFCSLSPHEENKVSLEISHLNVQKPWHGRNFFRRIDRSIEEEIAEFVLTNIEGASALNGSFTFGEQ
ncbi:MAG: hypothetical protein H6658_01495 [Ardenticatenaceae bacterium]|nr:hypothetical protein [Ardenticatenaceae bacterium]